MAEDVSRGVGVGGGSVEAVSVGSPTSASSVASDVTTGSVEVSRAFVGVLVLVADGELSLLQETKSRIIMIDQSSSRRRVKLDRLLIARLSYFAEAIVTSSGVVGCYFETRPVEIP
jgi:hypothetical protein